MLPQKTPQQTHRRTRADNRGDDSQLVNRRQILNLEQQDNAQDERKPQTIQGVPIKNLQELETPTTQPVLIQIILQIKNPMQEEVSAILIDHKDLAQFITNIEK